MAQQPETRFKENVVSQLSHIKECWYFKTQLVALLGIPDIIGCRKGYFFALELKTNKGKPTKLQIYILRLIKKAGGYAEICRPDNLNQCIDEIMELGEYGS